MSGGNSIRLVPPGIPPSNLVMYSNGVMDTVNWPDANDVSFSCTQNYTYTTNPKIGHTNSLQITTTSAFGGGWQRSSNWGVIPPTGFDGSAFTSLRFSVNIPTNTGIYVAGHYTRSTGNDISISTSATQGSTIFTPIQSNTWTDIIVPLSSLGHLSSYNMYKTTIGTSNNVEVYQLDDVIWAVGNTGWIYRGRLTGIEPGWTDASTATADYTWLPQTLGASCYAINNPPQKASVGNGSVSGTALTMNSISSGAISINEALFYNSATKGTIASGSGLNWTISGSAGNTTNTQMSTAPYSTDIPGMSLTAAAQNGMWKATHAGFNISSYSTFTFGVIPTKSGYGYQVQFYDTGGNTIGNAVTALPYTLHDFGISTSKFTVYNMPFSVFGQIGTVIGGVSIKETSSNTTNTTYFSALGFYS